MPPTALILATLGSIVSGWATPTEGAALGCVGALAVTAVHGQLNWAMFKDSTFRTAQTASMVMILLMASTFLGSVFSALGTPMFIANTLVAWNVPPELLIISILMLCFILGWPLEWVPIVVIIVPIFMPILALLKVDMVWFCILLAVTLQTCWLSPPVALSAYYLKGIMPSWDLADIYKGMLPFMAPAVGRRLDSLFLPADHSACFPNHDFRAEVGRTPTTEGGDDNGTQEIPEIRRRHARRGHRARAACIALPRVRPSAGSCKAPIRPARRTWSSSTASRRTSTRCRTGA